MVCRDCSGLIFSSNWLVQSTTSVEIRRRYHPTSPQWCYFRGYTRHHWHSSYEYGDLNQEVAHLVQLAILSTWKKTNSKLRPKMLGSEGGSRQPSSLWFSLKSYNLFQVLIILRLGIQTRWLFMCTGWSEVQQRGEDYDPILAHFIPNSVHGRVNFALFTQPIADLFPHTEVYRHLCLE
jgi:hypothetical protein